MFRLTLVTADGPLAAAVEPLALREGLEFVRLEAFDEALEPDPAAAPDVLCIDLRESRPLARSPYQEPWAKAFALGVVTPTQVPDVDPTLGLDDFITAPLYAPEFVARVQQILWRHGRSTAGKTLAAGDLVMDLTTYQLFESGHGITLTYKEYELLRFLMTHAGTVFNREQLLNRVWGYNYYGGSRTVDVHVRRLRSKLERAGHEYIETVRNVGYRFSQPLR
jgi:DNA-binding winged helix-turn-helix (wHTH) protein